MNQVRTPALFLTIIGMIAITASTQAITIDASGHYANWDVRTYPTTVTIIPATAPGVVVAALAPGDYEIRLYTLRTVQFSVDAGGNIQYAAADEQYLSGAGTMTLTVDAYNISIDASGHYSNWDLQSIPVINTLISSNPASVQAATMPPGDYQIRLFSLRTVPFAIDGNGLVQYDASQEPYISGAGTSVVTVDAHLITIDASTHFSNWDVQSSPNIVNLIFSSPPGVQVLTMPPGGYRIRLFGDATHEFLIDNGGNVQYAPGLESVLDGAGTQSLSLDSPSITVDASAHFGNFDVRTVPGGVQLITATPAGVAVIPISPGDYRVVLYGFASRYFTIDGSGNVELTPAEANYLSGAGTTTLTVIKHPITIDTSAHGGNWDILNISPAATVQPATPAGVHVIELMPGDQYNLRLYGIGGQPFEVDADGIVQYDPVVSNRLQGFGSPTITTCDGICPPSTIDCDAIIATVTDEYCTALIADPASSRQAVEALIEQLTRAALAGDPICDDNPPQCDQCISDAVAAILAQ